MQSSSALEQVLYAVVVFVVSAVLMILEITAGRLIAPYVGMSLYTWTGIIGVVLAGLSLGSWLGGVAADGGAGRLSVAVYLMVSGLLSIAVLLVLTWLAPILGQLSLGLVGVSLGLATGLFFLPSVALGMLSPLLTALALESHPRPGRVLGRMHALSALGGICGTFAAGFWLIQTFGTRDILIAVGAISFLCALPFLFMQSRKKLGLGLMAGALLLGLLLTGAASARNGFENPCYEESAYFCIRVDDASADAPFGEARALVLDYLLHGINHREEPGMLIAPYVHLVDELALGFFGERAHSARYLFLGGGAYTHPRAVHSLSPEAIVVVAELDPAVTEVAREQLYVDTQGMEILHQDARAAIKSMQPASFEVIIGDVFHDISIPFHLLTSEFFAEAKTVLTPDGVMLLNIVDIYPSGRLVQSVVRTLKTQFAEVHVFVEVVPQLPERLTYVISATDRPAPPEFVYAQRGFERQWRRVTGTVTTTEPGTEPAPVLTDDFAPIEALISPLLLGKAGR